MSNINVNVQYDYSSQILGNVSGGTYFVPANLAAPHPIAVVGSGDTVTDLSAITLGGFNGLNN